MSARRRYCDRPLAKRLLYLARARAVKFDHQFDIGERDIQALIPADGRCPALGIPFSSGTRTQRDASPSLDRIDPDAGYVRGNVAVISMRANRIKSNATPDELEAVARWVRATRTE